MFLEALSNDTIMTQSRHNHDTIKTQDDTIKTQLDDTISLIRQCPSCIYTTRVLHAHICAYT